jgi:hypothetical protein
MACFLSIISVVKDPARDLALTAASVAREQGGAAGDVEHLVKLWQAPGAAAATLAPEQCVSGPVSMRMPDTGVFDGMNQALVAARGTFVLFLNAGDVLENGMLARLRAAVAAHPDADYCMFDGLTVDAEDGRAFPRCAPERLRLRDFVVRTPVLHPCLVVRKNVLEALGGFDQRFTLAADFDLMVRLAAGGWRGVRVPQVGARMLSGGLSQRHRLRARSQAVRALLRQTRDPWIWLLAVLYHGRFFAYWIIRDVVLARFPGVCQRLKRPGIVAGVEDNAPPVTNRNLTAGGTPYPASTAGVEDNAPPVTNRNLTAGGTPYPASAAGVEDNAPPVTNRNLTAGGTPYPASAAGVEDNAPPVTNRNLTAGGTPYPASTAGVEDNAPPVTNK